MPETRSARQIMINKWISEIADTNFITEGDIVTYQACNSQITCDRKSQLTQHANTTVHRRNKQWRNHSEASTSNQVSYRNPFYKDLCQAMVAIKMPWRCLNNITWKNFLKKYTGQNVPNESTLRKITCKIFMNRVFKTFQKTLQSITFGFL